MGPQTQRLIIILGELAALLESDGESRWRHLMIEAKSRLESSDYSGIEYLLGAYGGMGSFNDLIICQDYGDGRSSWRDGYREKNDRLDALRSTAWDLARWISRHYGISNAEGAGPNDEEHGQSNVPIEPQRRTPRYRSAWLFGADTCEESTRKVIPTDTSKPPTSMRENAFIGKKEEPSQTELATALGPAKAVWDQLLADLAEKYGVTIHEWKCYSLKWGWSLRAKRGKRTILSLSPRAGCFGVLFIFGAKAMSAVQQCKLPERVKKALSEAQKYPEGTGLRLEVKSLREISALRKLAAIKLAN